MLHFKIQMRTQNKTKQEKGLTMREVKKIAKYIMSPEAKHLTQLSVHVCQMKIKH